MSIGNWLKADRKQVITHLSIIAAFVLLTIFVVEPLFDRLERIPGEAALHRLRLPTVTNDIVYHIDDFLTDGSIAVEVKGWAFIDGYDSPNSGIHIVLRSPDSTYVFDSLQHMREDVALRFAYLNLDLNYSGFSALIPVTKIRDGHYNVGIHIKKGDVEALQYVDHSVVKSRGSITCTFMVSTSQDVRLPPESDNIRVGIDVVQTVGGEDELTYIAGWAFIEDRGIENGQIYIVLKSDSAIYVFDAIQFERPDVAAVFVDTGWNLKKPGFKARIPRQQVTGGDYLLGIYIKKGEIETLRYTDRLVGF